MKKWVLGVVGVVAMCSIFFAFRSEQKTNPSIAGLPVTYSGITNAAGQYSFTFQNAYTKSPNVQANVIGGNDKTTVVVNRTAAGFTVTAYQRSAVTILGLEVLLAATTPLVGSQVDVLVTASE